MQCFRKCFAEIKTSLQHAEKYKLLEGYSLKEIKELMGNEPWRTGRNVRALAAGTCWVRLVRALPEVPLLLLFEICIVSASSKW